MDKVELKPCPFNCGRSEPALSSRLLGTARELMTVNDQCEYDVRCHCGAQGPKYSTKAEAIIAWNTRAALQSPSPEAEAMREAAGALIASKFSTYRAKNGRQVGIQDDNGEMCWIVPADEMFALEEALRNLPIAGGPSAAGGLFAQDAKKSEFAGTTFETRSERVARVWAEAIKEAAAGERAAIVAWLRSFRYYPHGSVLADQIEAAAHLPASGLAVGGEG